MLFWTDSSLSGCGCSKTVKKFSNRGLSKFQELVMDREACRAAVHEVARSSSAITKPSSICFLKVLGCLCTFWWKSAFCQSARSDSQTPETLPEVCFFSLGASEQLTAQGSLCPVPLETEGSGFIFVILPGGLHYPAGLWAPLHNF